MSGICGFFERKGKQAEAEQLYTMAGFLERRGPDGAGYWHEGQVAMANLLLWTTPESKKEQLPLVGNDNGLVLVSDARIDNRSDLLTEFGFSASEKENIPDSHFILEAYKKWGADCPRHLLGDYAFVIWDSERKKMFCGRDHLGARPFYFFLSDTFFAFSSEIKALFAIPEIEVHINESNIADFLQRISSDTASTCYKDIFRLRPASTLLVEIDDIREAIYWKTDPENRLPVAADEEYAEEFLRIFTESVRCRLRSAYPVGCTLSGGLDSSSVACVARNILAERGEKLHTFSAIFPGLSAEDRGKIDEQQYQQAVINQGGFVHHPFRADLLDPVANLGKYLQCCEEPYFAPNLFLLEEADRLAQENGVRVMLDGLDGDSVVSHGYERLHGLACSGRWLTLIREIILLAERQGVNRKSMLKRRLFRPYCREPLAHLWHMCKSYVNPGWNFLPLINKEFGIKAGLDKRLNTRLCIFDTPFEAHHQVLSSPLQTKGLELQNCLAASFSLNCCSPFYDRRLMEFCLALPPRQKLQKGWGRYVLRKSMGGILPEEVRWRPDKGNLSKAFSSGLLSHHENKIGQWLQYREDYLDQILQKEVLMKKFEEFTEDPLHRSGFLLDLYCVLILQTWLATLERRKCSS
ncbi:MAG: lasso peptide isopeptide bond-forming cyclase [Proteobacteria bacterium]|nr:lasso peptide isopeptide bond-forming cyclase [Pseudomonadota bacterium]